MNIIEKELKNKDKPTKINNMTTQELAEQEGVARVTVIKWCRNNGVKRKLGKNGVMEYDLSKKDVQNFINRKPKGRPKQSL